MKHFQDRTRLIKMVWLWFLQETSCPSICTATSWRMSLNVSGVIWWNVPSIFDDIFIQIFASHIQSTVYDEYECACLCVCMLKFGPMNLSSQGLVAARLLGQRSGQWHQRNIQGGGSKFTRHSDCPRLHPLRLWIDRGLLRGMHPLAPGVWTWHMKKQRNLTRTGHYLWPLI